MFVNVGRFRFRPMDPDEMQGIIQRIAIVRLDRVEGPRSKLFTIER